MFIPQTLPKEPIAVDKPHTSIKELISPATTAKGVQSPAAFPTILPMKVYVFHTFIILCHS